MSYLHCPTCRRAYNLATQPSCPHCAAVSATASVPAPASMPAPASAPAAASTPAAAPPSLAAAVEQLASALARATPSERAIAAASLSRLAEPDRDDPPPARAAIVPRALQRAPRPPPRAPRYRPLLAAIASAVIDRLAPHAPDRLVRAVARVKALAS
jgi:hypothetical protein